MKCCTEKGPINLGLFHFRILAEIPAETAKMLNNEKLKKKIK